MDRFVLDSDTITYVLQKKGSVAAHLAEATKANAEIYLCPVVYYQVRRGLLEKGATRQLREFDARTASLLWADFERPMWDDAARTWVACRRRARPHDDDADLLIAAYARHHRATVVTTNSADFEDLEVRLVNWLA